MATAFGTHFMPEMASSYFDGVSWSTPGFQSSQEMMIHPAAHVLHYASTCFEGLKAFRHENGRVVMFRIEQNIARFAQSSAYLGLPAIDPTITRELILKGVVRYADEVPMAPGSMYIRPTHMGLEPCIGKAAAASNTSLQFVLLSPVGDYFAGGEASLKLLVDDQAMRCAPDHGMVKGGGNYASALKHIVKARQDHSADQVLFCPDGDVQETGAANFLLIDGDEVITKPLDESFLHGVTRSSILQLAKDMGLKVAERNFSVTELIERVAHPECEAALSGTAAVLASVGQLIYQHKVIPVGTAKPGSKVAALRKALNDIQWGQAADKHNWLTEVRPANT